MTARVIILMNHHIQQLSREQGRSSMRYVAACWLPGLSGRALKRELYITVYIVARRLVR